MRLALWLDVCPTQPSSRCRKGTFQLTPLISVQPLSSADEPHEWPPHEWQTIQIPYPTTTDILITFSFCPKVTTGFWEQILRRSNQIFNGNLESLLSFTHGGNLFRKLSPAANPFYPRHNPDSHFITGGKRELIRRSSEFLRIARHAIQLIHPTERLSPT
jgi:hypothetical protein